MLRLSELTNYVCTAETTIRQLLGLINTNPYLFQVVVDEAGRPLGTVTDGDIRRALLRGVSVDAAATICMRDQPLTGHLGQDAENLSKLQNVKRHVKFLPVVDAAGLLRHILVSHSDELGISTALVMAGGPGTRLGKLTEKTPKPLLPVANKPILEWVLEGLEQNGVSQIYISTHYLAEQIDDFIAARANKASIVLLRETRRMGTAGALTQLPKPLSRPVLVINGDVISKVDLTAMEHFHESQGYDGTIGIAPHDIEIPFGVIRQGSDGSFAGIDEKPTIRQYVSAGIYYLSPECIGLVPTDRPLDMPELLNMAKQIGLRFGLFPIHEYWRDIGRPEQLAAADQDYQA